MASLCSRQNQKNHQRVFEGKENVTGQNKKSAQPKNQRTVFSTLQGTSQIEPSKNRADQSNRASHFVPSQVHPAFTSEKSKEPTFEIYEDMVQGESSVKIIKAVKAKKNVTLKEIYIIEENSMEVEDFSISKNLFSCTLSPIKLELTNLTSTPSVETPTVHREDHEYLVDNFNSMKSAELKYRPRADYVKKQPFIDDNLRAILVDWLVTVTNAYRMQTETLYLAVSYVDRFLSKMSVVVSKLQLVGVTALMIAAKFEEVMIPRLADYVELTDNSYTKEITLKTERLILQSLTFDLIVPTPLTFLDVYCFYAGLSDEVKFLAMYICELTLLKTVPFLQFLPSCLAAASVALAQHTLREQVWPRKLEIFSGYALADLQACLAPLNETFKNADKLKLREIKRKYESKKYMHIARIQPRSTGELDNNCC